MSHLRDALKRVETTAPYNSHAKALTLLLTQLVAEVETQAEGLAALTPKGE